LVAVALLVAVAGCETIISSAARSSRDWQFVQSVGGLALGTPQRDDRGHVLPIRCDVSGTRTITVHPTAINSALAGVAQVAHDHCMQVEVEREEDGRWIAEVPVLPGAMAYGASKAEAVAKVEALVLRVLADKIEHGEEAPGIDRVFTVAA
jgi:predicted RNase H-like HicB family nuclease